MSRIDEEESLEQSTSNEKKAVVAKPPKRKTLECPGCAKSYCTVVSLQYHIRRAHPDVRDELHNIVKAGQWKCTQFQCVMSSEGCMEVCKSRNELLRHLENVHNIGVDWVEEFFTSLSEFDQYRVGLRSKGHFFIKATSRRKGRTAAEEPFILFRCNREGTKVIRKGNKDKSKGSIKIGTFCTAYLKVFFRKDSTIRCAGSLTHCNHEINYQVREIEGNISGRVKLIQKEEEDDEEADIEEGHPSPSSEVMVENDVSIRTQDSLEFEDRSFQQEMHIVHLNGDDTVASSADISDTIEMIVQEANGQNSGDSSALLYVTQEDSSAHRSFNSLVEDTIWKLQKIQEERTGQRLIFYADALHQLVRSAHESISKTVMEHLQKNKSRRTLAEANSSSGVQV